MKTETFFNPQTRVYETTHKTDCRDLYAALNNEEFIQNVFDRIAKSLADKIVLELNPAINEALKKLKENGIK
jgi:hypothetical protein